MKITKKEQLEASEIYNYLNPILSQNAKNQSVFQTLKKEILKILDRNASVLQTNIIGKQLHINVDEESTIYKIIGVDKKELVDAFENSEYFKAFENNKSLKEQTLFAVVLIMLSSEYLKLNKTENAKFIFFSAFLKPYATIIAKYFPYGVNDDKMQYVIEYIFSDKNDIRKLGTVLNVLLKKSETALDNYLDVLKNEPIADKDLDVVFRSGIYSRLNNMVKDINSQYLNNKDKYLPFEMSSFQGEDDLGGATFLDRDIQSSAAVVSNLVRKTVMKVVTNPPDTKAIIFACKKAFGISTPRYEYMLKEIIAGIVDKLSDRLTEYISVMLNSVLNSSDPRTGNKYTAMDLQSPLLLVAVLEVFKTPNSQEGNILKLKEMTNELLEMASSEYVSAKGTKRAQLRTAVVMYFAALCRMS